MAPERARRKYGAACVVCRQKKISCDGQRPRCNGCIGTDEQCIYVASQRHLRHRQPSDAHSPTPTLPAPTPTPGRATAVDSASMEERMRRVEEMLGLGPLSAPTVSSSASRPTPASVQPEPRSYEPSNDLPSSKYRLMVDQKGNIVYHGLTGLTTTDESDNYEPAASANEGPSEWRDPAFAPIFQALAASRHITVSPEIGEALLQCHFCYSAPVFAFVIKSPFLRDMAMGGGPAFSEFLLMTLYASGTRMIDGLDEQERQTQGDLFIRLSRELLAKELAGPSKITTVQGLLLMSARECAVGNSSQGWIYAGIAFRLIQDLGIHLPWENVPGSSRLSLEERDVRDRLFWSAMLWDKTISLAVGREPTFPPRLGHDPSRIPQFENDDLPWTPFYSNPRNCPRTLLDYVYRPNNTVATFRAHAKLSLIVHDIITELYSPDTRLTPPQRVTFAARTRSRLEAWWIDFPDDMKGPTTTSPPPWVYTVQMLYHACWILLYRPLIDEHGLRTVEGHIETCLYHSIVCFQLSSSFEETFKGKLSYLGMYCAFVSATFDIFSLKAERLDTQLSALSRLKSWLEILGKSAKQGPSIKRSIHTISESTFKHVAQDPILASSDVGKWIMHQHTANNQVSPAPSAPGHYGAGVFDFLELWGPALTTGTTG